MYFCTSDITLCFLVFQYRNVNGCHATYVCLNYNYVKILHIYKQYGSRV